MKNGEVIREALLNNTIHLIGKSGFEGATTRAIVCEGIEDPAIRLNEVYIYRIFGSKELLYEEAFLRLDRELFCAFQNEVRATGGFEEDTREKLYDFFLKAWRFILGNEERCRCYVRYYYSVYFKGHSLKHHKEQFEEMVAEMTLLFKDEADVEAILHSIFTALFDFAIRVYNGELEDSDINRPHIFNVLYCMMATYFKDSVKAS